MPLPLERKTEVVIKLERLRKKMSERRIDAVKLTSIASTSWITAGARLYVDESTDLAASSLLITEDRAFIVTNSIEAPRLEQEEELGDLGFEFLVKPWYADTDAASSLLINKHVGLEGASETNTVDISTDLRHLRSVLQEE
jgi:Xaa-Pro aminopeptidase